jgi:hypothetical protein
MVETYSFGDGAPTGIWLGLGVTRLMTVGAGLLTAVGALAVGAGLPVAALTAALPAAIALLPTGGRPVIGWIQPLASHCCAALTGRTGWCAAAPTTVLTALPTPEAQQTSTYRHTRLRLPGEYGRNLLLLEPTNTDEEHSLCFVLEPAAGTLTVLFEVAGVDRYPLLEPAEQDRLLAGWGDAMTWLGRDRDLLRLQLLDRTRPAAVPHVSEQTRPNGKLTGLLAELCIGRDSLLAVQFRADAFRPVGKARRDNGVAGLDVAAVTARARQLARALLAAQLVARPAAAERAQQLIADLLTPRPDGAAVVSRAGNADADGWGGLSRRRGWDHVRIDDTVHRSFAVSRWPASPQGGNWLAPLLLTAPPDAARTLAVHLEPLTSADAARAARAARTRAELDRADRFRLGLSETAQADRAAETGRDLDADLVAGHSALRLSAVLTVSAADQTGLDEASRQLQQAAAGCRLQLRPLHGQHDLALAATVPLCRSRTAGAL